MTARIVQLRYPAASEVVASPEASSVKLSLDAGRAHVGFSGNVLAPELMRDAWLTAIAILQSDLRYKGKDRAAYLAFLMKKGKKASKAVWEAQKTFLDAAYADDIQRSRGLDPLLTVDPEEISLEVFSRDESAYARLAFANEMFAGRTAAHGSTCAQLSAEFIEQLERVRVYQPVKVEASPKLSGTATPHEVLLPDAWLRGFLQVQSAATLPTTTAQFNAIDLYNVLTTLRLRRAKKAPRALRFELVPGQPARLVLEPWEVVLESHGALYQGRTPRVIKTYGRQRLLALARALPHVKSVKVHLLGPGLPSFWTLDMGLARLTVALTSWAESSWASATSFDALMPRAAETAGVDRVTKLLFQKGPRTLEELASELKLSTKELRPLLQRACLRGQVLFDIDRQRYRPRALLSEPVNDEAIRYGSEREALAHRLLGDEGKSAAEIRVTKLHDMVGEGQEVAGEVVDKQQKRSFAPRFLIDLEGQVREAWCNCTTYQRSAMREGPCEHMIALYLHHKRAQEEAERLRKTPEGRALVRAETRTLVRRDAAGKQTSFRVSLDDRLVRIEKLEQRPGKTAPDTRLQRLWFDTDAQARDAYYARLDALAEGGFIDTESLTG